MLQIRKLWNIWSGLARRESSRGNDGVSSDLQGGEQSEIALRQLRRIMPDFYFVNTPTPHMVRHWNLLQKLPKQDTLLDFHRHAGSHLTHLTIASYDDTRPGLLSKVCGTLASFSIDVKSALIYTASGQKLHEVLRESDPDLEMCDACRQIALDSLVLSEPYRRHERPLSERTQRALHNELRSVLRDEVTVGQLLAGKSLRPLQALVIHQIEAQLHTESGSQPLVRIAIRAADSSGVLYRTTAALASLGLNIVVAQINTTDSDITDDIFFVCGANNEPLSEEEVQTIPARLRSQLQSLEGTQP